MWRLACTCCAAFLIFFFCLPVISIAVAGCGGDPPTTINYSWPAVGPISNAWSLDCRTDKGHRGIDIEVPPGTPVVASASGVVAFAGYTPAENGGMTVALEHEGGIRTTYLHLFQIIVEPGQQVSRGQVLAQTDGTPLHFGMKLAGTEDLYFNPVAFLPALEMDTSSDVDDDAAQEKPETSAALASPAENIQEAAPSAPETAANLNLQSIPAEPLTGTVAAPQPVSIGNLRDSPVTRLFNDSPQSEGPMVAIHTPDLSAFNLPSGLHLNKGRMAPATSGQKSRTAFSGCLSYSRTGIAIAIMSLLIAVTRRPIGKAAGSKNPDLETPTVARVVV